MSMERKEFPHLLTKAPDRMPRYQVDAGIGVSPICDHPGLLRRTFPSPMNIFVLSIGFGVVTASILAIAAIGVTLQFGVTNYINFAYGEFMTLGAYIAWFANTQLGLSIWIAMLIAGLGVALVSLAISRFVLDYFVKQRTPVLFLLIVTFGLSLILSNLMLGVFGFGYRQFSEPSQRPLRFGPWQFTADQLGIIVVAVAVMVGVHLLLQYTTLGKSMRAMSDNRALAELSGIDTDQVTAWAWFVSGFLAGLSGFVFALNAVTFDSSLGGTFLFVIFAAVILGGIGKPHGAMLGALVIGLATELAAAVFDPAYKNDVAFLVLIVFVLVRPQGLLRSRARTA